ncbi:MAG: cytochrome c oxidase accessory protein CcoG [Alphaproteobacteria bacterium]|nr:cytochrome c oxidase accessory protein CcoG [Alphaproteobacteria bacterium]
MQPNNSQQQPSQPQPAANSNDEITLFAKAEKVFPRSVKGHFRNLKWMAMAVCLAIYYLAPFIRWDRGPNAPDQAILIDLPNRRAYWFLVEIWPQEVYYLAAILVFAAIALFFVTSLFGRVWCGYFCFHTVWTDLFVLVERAIQGERGERKRLHEGKWTFEKAWKLGLTHFLWFNIAFLTSGAFVLYFNDAPTLLHSFLNREVSPTVLGFMGGLTLSTYIMAGFAREQVCIYMCPYSRFQSGMFDPDTLIIGYDKVRGEPRGKHRKGESWDGKGHCIDCSACVQVCPMGIDIRNGLQIDCIACGLCIDACNDIMDKMSLPRGLIRYDTERGLEKGGMTRHLLRPRTIYYSVVLTIVACIVGYTLLTRAPLELHVIHDRNPLFVKMSDGNIHNGYDIKILNKTHDVKTFAVSVEGLEGASVEVRGAGDLKAESLPVGPDSVGQFHVFIKSPAPKEQREEIEFSVKDNATGFTDTHESIFISGGTE